MCLVVLLVVVLLILHLLCICNSSIFRVLNLVGITVMRLRLVFG